MGPRRIVCLTEEPTETLYLLGEQERIVGISGFTVRPPEARREKPKVSAFTSANVEKILALEPDFAIGFSDMQADIARSLVLAGIEVWIANHRTVDGILEYVRRLGALVGASAKAAALVASLQENLDRARTRAAGFARRPKVYFEEWDEPQISAIHWVSELVEIAGGDNVFPELAIESLGRNRIIADPAEVIRRAPDAIIASWCGKKFQPAAVAQRPGWDAIPAVRTNELHEVKSPLILQPGPAALTSGLDALSAIIAGWASRNTESAARPDPGRAG